jgi:aminomethyltransferase
MEAKFAVEGGWNVPLVYSSVLDEVGLARSQAAVVDVSSISRFRIRGHGAVDLLSRLCTHDVVHQEDDTAELTCLCNRLGGVLDCGYLLRLETDWILTGWPGNRAKLAEHLEEHAADFDVKVTDQTESTCQFAAIGPEAPRRLDAILPEKISTARPGSVRVGNYLVARVVASRTAYTDLWGLEVTVPKWLAAKAWTLVTRKAGQNALAPIGHAARDVLRIEAGCVRYGHEIHEMIDPITAGLGRCVRPGPDCIGAEALEQIQSRGPGRRLVRLESATGQASPGPRIPRLGDPVFDAEGNALGQVTSGTFSPSIGAPVALALLQTGAARPESWLEIRSDRSSQQMRLVECL